MNEYALTGRDMKPDDSKRLFSTLHTDASLVCVTSFRVVGFTFVNTLIVKGEERQGEGGALSSGARLGRHQSVHLPPPQFRNWTVGEVEGERKQGGGE